MIVGVCTIKLRLHGVRSLKDKRSIVKGLVERLRQRLNVGAAEVGALDQWDAAVIGLSTVSLSEAVIRELFAAAERLAEQAPGAELLTMEIELL